jgi:peptidoglycan/LPS O-acetylase OafA/YrhL
MPELSKSETTPEASPAPADSFGGVRLHSLDVLRALAALSVLAAHWISWTYGAIKHPSWVQGSLDAALQFMLKFLANEDQMFGGVLLFIVLSGFCIHWPNAGKAVPPRWKSFFIRRFLRIYPVFFVATVFGLLAIALAKSRQDAHTLACLGYVETTIWHVLAKVFILSHFVPGPDFQKTFIGNAPLATVVTEWWLYAFYPVAHFIKKRAGWVPLFALGFLLYALCPLLAQAGGGYGAVYHSFSCFFIFWIFGAWLAQRMRSGTPVRSALLWWIAGVALLAQIGLVFVLPVRTGRFVSMLLQGVSFGALILVLAQRDTATTRPRHWASRSLSWLGERSYSLYAFHAPVLNLTLMVMLAGGSVIGALSALLMPLLVCMGLYPIIEKPAHGLAIRFSAK